MTDRVILIADDDKDLVELLSFRCRSLGLGVFTAHDALDALTKIDRHRPDVVIFDVEMPGGNGLSACEMMANHKELSNIPVIVMTGRSDKDTVRRCHLSCAYYVPKSPDIWQRLEPLISDLLELELADSAVQ